MYRIHKMIISRYRGMVVFVILVGIPVSVASDSALVPDSSPYKRPLSKAAQQCNVSVLASSAYELENYIFSKTTSLIYFYVVYHGQTSSDYKSPTRWVWADYKGLNILQMDYRYMVFSLATMKSSCNFLQVNITDSPTGCCSNLPVEDKHEKIAFAIAKVGQSFVSLDDSNGHRDQYVCFQNYTKNRQKTCSTQCKIVKYHESKVNFFGRLNCSFDTSTANPDNWTTWCNLHPKFDGLYYMVHIFVAVFALYALLLTGYMPDTGQVLTREEIQNRMIPQFHQMDKKHILNAPENETENETERTLAVKTAGSSINASNSETLAIDVENYEGCSPMSTSRTSTPVQSSRSKKKKSAVTRYCEAGIKTLDHTDVDSISSDSSANQSPTEALIRTSKYFNYGTSYSVHRGTGENQMAGIVSYSKEYVNVNHIPAVTIADLFHFIWFSPASPCVVRMRRLVFVVLLPFHLYIMACVDLCLYPYATAFHAQSMDPFLSTVDYFLTSNWERLDASTWAGVPLYLFSLLTYGIASILFVFRAPLDLDHLSDDGRFLGRPFPEGLNTFPSKPRSHGWQDFCEVLQHRACLILDKQFWRFYISDITFNLHVILRELFPEMRRYGLLDCLTVCMYPFWLLWMCVAWLLLTPLGVVLNRIATVLLRGFYLSEQTNPSEKQEERLSGVAVGTTQRHFVTCFSLIVMLIWLFVALSVFLVGPTTHMLSALFRYTIQGLLLNHTKLLPHVILAMAAVFYVLKFYYEFPDLYRRLTLTLFEEAAKYQSPNNAKDCHNHALLLTDEFGQKWLPRDLYKHVYTRILPIRQAALHTGIKIILSLAFICFLYEILFHFDLLDDSGLGQSLVTLLIVQAPRLTGLFPEHTGKCVDLFQQRGEVRSILETYVQKCQQKTDSAQIKESCY